MNRFEAQSSYTHIFAHLSFLKDFSYNMYKIFLNTIFCLQTQFYVLYISLIKTILLNFKISSKFFFQTQFLAWAGRPSGRPTLGQVRTVDRPSRPHFWQFGACMCARLPIDRSVDRSHSSRPGGWPTEVQLLSVCFRSTERSTENLQRLFYLNPGRPRESFQP